MKIEKEALEREINEAEELLQANNNYIEELEACIEFNEVAEKIAPAVQKVNQIIRRRGTKNNPFKTVQTHNGEYFSNIDWGFTNNVFENIPKIYLNKHCPDTRDRENALIKDNLWHYNVKYAK
ncbi:MAG: hypothetical protein AB1782_14855 [Cyanobacteriota bacterium]